MSDSYISIHHYSILGENIECNLIINVNNTFNGDTWFCFVEKKMRCIYIAKPPSEEYRLVKSCSHNNHTELKYYCFINFRSSLLLYNIA